MAIFPLLLQNFELKSSLVFSSQLTTLNSLSSRTYRGTPKKYVQSPAQLLLCEKHARNIPHYLNDEHNYVAYECTVVILLSCRYKIINTAVPVALGFSLRFSRIAFQVAMIFQYQSNPIKYSYIQR